jgi:hypothetical protein
MNDKQVMQALMNWMCNQLINLMYLVGLCRPVLVSLYLHILHEQGCNKDSTLQSGIWPQSCADDHGLEQGVGLGLVGRSLRWMGIRLISFLLEPTHPTYQRQITQVCLDRESCSRRGIIICFSLVYLASVLRTSIPSIEAMAYLGLMPSRLPQVQSTCWSIPQVLQTNSAAD